MGLAYSPRLEVSSRVRKYGYFERRVPGTPIVKMAPRAMSPTTYAIGPAHSILAAQGAPGPLHIPAVCWEEAVALPHRDSALPAPARAEETFFFFSVVHTIVSLAAPIHGLSHYPPHLPMEPTLGPGAQVNSRGGWRFQGKGGLLGKDAAVLGACRPTVCVCPGTP